MFSGWKGARGLYSGRGGLSLSLPPPEERKRRSSIFSCLMPARALSTFLTTRGSICPRLMSPPVHTRPTAPHFVARVNTRARWCFIVYAGKMGLSYSPVSGGGRRSASNCSLRTIALPAFLAETKEKWLNCPDI